MSNPNAIKQDLDQLARVQQMKINTRLVALETAMKLMNTPNYSVLAYENDPANPSTNTKPVLTGGTVDLITLLASAQEVEGYILGNIEAETTEALAAAKAKLNAPRIVRP